MGKESNPNKIKKQVQVDRLLNKLTKRTKGGDLRGKNLMKKKFQLSSIQIGAFLGAISPYHFR
jgi:hypothetical protein